ncbi:14656_t:CDS:2 [Dentiscutata heterogama]|uniref:14656_t:CDS:1 n=1 Tax=Dentiscutata heterogama TaxID=1316150 RepID=A0ACA9KU33_9GLOM|nr:14656_t:CDS:2 [Dentiscutata heterogama]
MFKPGNIENIYKFGNTENFVDSESGNADNCFNAFNFGTLDPDLKTFFDTKSDNTNNCIFDFDNSENFNKLNSDNLETFFNIFGLNNEVIEQKENISNSFSNIAKAYKNHDDKTNSELQYPIKINISFRDWEEFGK